MAALQYVDVPGYSALLLRRTFADLNQAGAIMDRTWHWLIHTDAKPVRGGVVWRFPSGARLTFGYVQYHKDVQQYQSAEFQYIGIDESTQWEERTYQFLFSRIRRPKNAARLGRSKWDGLNLSGVPLRMRCAANPGGIGHAWHRKRFVNPKTRVAPFIPAKLEDNPSLDYDEYVASLSYLDPVTRARLLAGDWAITDENTMFKRWWFEIVDGYPRDDRIDWCRYWDLASTEVKQRQAHGGDWTAGCLLGRDRYTGELWIADMARERLSPSGVEKLVARVARHDADRFGDRYRVRIRMEREPGSAGVNTISHYQRNVIPGYPFDEDLPSGSKSERARPVSSLAENGLVKVVRGAWNDEFFDEIETFPESTWKDQVDALSGAYKVLTAEPEVRLIA